MTIHSSSGPRTPLRRRTFLGSFPSQFANLENLLNSSPELFPSSSGVFSFLLAALPRLEDLEARMRSAAPQSDAICEWKMKTIYFHSRFADFHPFSLTLIPLPVSFCIVCGEPHRVDRICGRTAAVIGKKSPKHQPLFHLN